MTLKRSRLNVTKQVTYSSAKVLIESGYVGERVLREDRLTGSSIFRWHLNVG